MHGTPLVKYTDTHTHDLIRIAYIIIIILSSSQQHQSKQRNQRGIFYSINFRGLATYNRYTLHTHTHIVDISTGRNGSLNWFILYFLLLHSSHIHTPVNGPAAFADTTNEQRFYREQHWILYHYSVLSITDLLHPKSGGCVVESEQKIFVYQINGYRKGCEICQPFVCWNKNATAAIAKLDEFFARII